MQCQPALCLPPSTHSMYDTPFVLQRRNRIRVACSDCRKRKMKCDGNLDGCQHCSDKDRECRFEPVSRKEKQKAQKYKRDLTRRRQHTQIQWDTLQGPETGSFGAVGAKSIFEATTASLPQIFQGSMQQLDFPVSVLSSPESSKQGFNPYFASATSPSNSVQLQSMTETSSFAPCFPLLSFDSFSSTPVLSSSLSSPALSVSSSASSSFGPVCDGPQMSIPIAAFLPSGSEQSGYVPGQVQFSNYTGGLELYSVPCVASSSVDPTSSTAALAINMTPSSAGSLAYASPEHLRQSLTAHLSSVSVLQPAPAPAPFASGFA